MADQLALQPRDDLAQSTKAITVLLDDKMISMEEKMNDDENIDRILEEIHGNEVEDDEAAPKMQSIEMDTIEYENNVRTPLGSGKFGKVYKGKWKGKTVAIKECFTADGYLQEKNMLLYIDTSKVDDKFAHLMRCYGYSDAGKSFVVEFIAGGSGDRLFYSDSESNIRSQVSLSNLIHFLTDAMKGIRSLHEMGIIHRDLSARNLLFVPSNKQQQYTVKLCDFGDSTINKDKASSRKGPYLWLSPESIRTQECNAKTDIYSFGILCWELLIGARPFPVSEVAVEVAVIQILCLSMRPLLNHPVYQKLIPMELMILIQQCWQELPQYRPKGTLEIIQKLQAIDMQHNSSQVKDITLNHIPSNHEQIAKKTEMLKDLQHLIFLYLDDEQRKTQYTQQTRKELLKQIFDHKFQFKTDLKAFEYYVNYFPWMEMKDSSKQTAAMKNVQNVLASFDIKLQTAITLDMGQ